ncbi:MAG: phage tail sheath subtilisin-like domain-containing protein [Deltaproteobacteria bacterium]|nr:phage tail sheath subtilisin-like domain-containing protein [Deltaproteobacteria bacterium]
MSGIVFNQLPPNNFSPASWVETGFGGGASNLPRGTLIVGYTHGATPGPVLEPKLISGKTHEWPRNSQIASKIRAFRRVNPYGELWAVALDDPSGGTAATRDVTVTGAATEDGTIPVYVADHRVDVAVVSGDTAADVAAAIETAVGTLADAPATASAASAVVTFTAVFTAEEGNQIVIDFAPKQGQKIPAGLGGLTRGNLTSGAGNGDITTALATVKEKRFYAVDSGLVDSTAITDLVEEMARRWLGTVELHGQGFVGIQGAVAAMAALGTGYNAEEITAMGAGLSLSPPWDWASAAAAADVAKSDPVTGWLGVKLTGLDAPETEFDAGERNTLLAAGVSTFRVDSGGVILDRLVTTRSKDADDNTDVTLLPLSLRRTAEALAFDWDSRVYNKYVSKNFKLATAPDVQIPPPGSRILSQSALRSEAVAWFIEKRAAGLVQDIDAFIAALNVQKNSGDPMRMDSFFSTTVLRELVTLATRLEVN